MDGSLTAASLQQQIANMSPAQQGELATMMRQEEARLAWQENIHKLTSLCSDRCIRTGNGQLDGKESACLSGCVSAFVASNLVIMKQMQAQRMGMSSSEMS